LSKKDIATIKDTNNVVEQFIDDLCGYDNYNKE
jgi:hypothetical protein